MEKAVFLSASIPDSKRDQEFALTADTVAIATAVSALLYVTLGRRRLVWGGHPAITPMVLSMCEAIDVEYGRWVTLYQSRCYEDRFPEDTKLFDNVRFVDRADGGSIEHSLEKMRAAMFHESEYSAAVFIGGMQGVLEEFRLFREMQPTALLLPVASTGGAAIQIAKELGCLDDRISSDLEYIGLFYRLLGIGAMERRFRVPEEQPTNREKRVRDLNDRRK